MLRTLILLLCMTSGVALANPSVAVEDYGLLGKGKPQRLFALGGEHSNPSWRSDFDSAFFYMGIPIGSHLLTFGAKGSASPKWMDRDAYFLGWDWVFKDWSVGVKAAHEDWNYIATGKDSVGADFSWYMGGKNHNGFFGSFGGYYRWLKQRWTTDSWRPFSNTNVADQEGYAQGSIGGQISLGHTGFLTFDMNCRDNFSYYTFDNLGFDVAIYPASARFTTKLLLGIRTTALVMGTAAISEFYFSLSTLFY